MYGFKLLHADRRALGKRIMSHQFSYMKAVTVTCIILFQSQFQSTSHQTKPEQQAASPRNRHQAKSCHSERSQGSGSVLMYILCLIARVRDRGSSMATHSIRPSMAVLLISMRKSIVAAAANRPRWNGESIHVEEKETVIIRNLNLTSNHYATIHQTLVHGYR